MTAGKATLPEADDLLVVGGRVHTCDAEHTVADALLVRGGRVADTGSREKLERLAGAARVIDVHGAAVYPGFCDTHMHLQKISRDMAMIHPAGSTNISEVLEAVARVTRTARPGHWIRTFADNESWHEHLLAERRLPTQAELDSVADGHAVFLYRRNDAAVLSSAAAARAEAWLAEVPPEDWSRESGYLSGSSVRAFNDWLYRSDLHSPDEEIEQLGNTSRRLLEMGITSVVDPGLAGGFSESWTLYSEAARRGELEQRVWLMNRLDYRRPFETELARIQNDPAPLTGTERLQAWAIKALLDGEFGNAWMRPGEWQSDSPTCRYTEDELRRLVKLCGDRGWPLCVHVMGAGALDAVIAAVRSVTAHGVEFAPAQISLAHAFLADAEALADLRELGIAVSVQPLLAHVFAQEMRDGWGDARAEDAIPLREMLESGLTVAGGSDTLPCEPLRGASIAVTRHHWDGRTFGEAHAIARQDALDLFLRKAGDYVNDSRVGQLVPGAFGDFVVWPTDPLALDTDDWLTLRPLATAVDGRLAWSDGTFPTGVDA